jgi:hypothetical protein
MKPPLLRWLLAALVAIAVSLVGVCALVYRYEKANVAVRVHDSQRKIENLKIKLLKAILVADASFQSTQSTLATKLSVITAKPRFKQRAGFVSLVVSDANQSFDIAWGAMVPKVQYLPLSLDTNVVYTFTVEQKPYREFVIPELHRVDFNGQTIYDIEVCEVHKVKMEHKEVTIHYGLPRPVDKLSADIERQLFPHSREYSLGGCVISPQSPKTTETYVCGRCKEAFEWWSGTATAPISVLPRDTRYDSDQHLRLVYLEAYGKGYVAAWVRKEALPVFNPTSEDDKARVLGYADGAVAGRDDRDAWSGANGQPYEPMAQPFQKR